MAKTKLAPGWSVVEMRKSGEWLNCIIEKDRPKTNGTKTIATRSGKRVTVNSTRNRFTLAWNGSRFARSKDLAWVKKRYQDLWVAFERFVQAEYTRW